MIIFLYIGLNKRFHFYLFCFCFCFFLAMCLLENFKLRIWLVFEPHRYRILKVILCISGINSIWCCFVYSVVVFFHVYLCLFLQNA